MDRPIRLLIANQNANHIMVPAEILASDPRVEIVGWAKDGDEVREMLETLKPDIMLLSGLPTCLVTMQSLTILERRISESLYKFGIPAHIKGYHYIHKAIAFSIENRENIEAVTKMLYPRIAKTFMTTPSCVERAIRHAIETAWDRSNTETLLSIIGHTAGNKNKKPTNSEFIATISEQLRTQSDEE